MNKQQAKKVIEKLSIKIVSKDNKDIQRAVINYLNKLYIPNEIGLCYNQSFKVVKFKFNKNCFFNVGSKNLYLCLQDDTVDAVIGYGVDSRRTVKTYTSTAYIFESKEDADRYAIAMNVLYNKEYYASQGEVQSA